MKKFFYSLVVILLCSVCVLTACGTKGLNDNPATNAPVSGNGGFAVVKGDYLYYTNGYDDDYKTNYASTSDNKFGSVTFGAIYRTKLNNGQVVYNEDGTLKSSELVVSKLVGYEQGGFYIFGDYIYYATPLMEKTSDGTLRNNWVNFCRIKIDGTDNKEGLYKSSSEVSRKDWNMYAVNGNVYLVLAENVDSKTTLTSIEINSKGKTTKRTLATEVTSFALYNGVADNAYAQNIYFTKDSSNNTLKGNQLATVNFTNGQVSNMSVNNTTYTVLLSQNHKVYYKAVTPISQFGDETITSLKYQSIDTPFETTQNIATEFGVNGYDEYAVAGYNSDIVVMRNSTTNILVSVAGHLNSHTIEGATSLIGFVGDNLYYLNSSNKLRKVQITSDYTNEYVSSDAFDNEKTINTSAFDANGNNLYLFSEYTAANGNKHLYLNKLDGSDARFVGVFASGHTPAPLDDADEDDIWIY